MINRRGAGYGDIRRAARGAARAAADAAPVSPLALLGSTVLRQWFDLRYGEGVGYTLNGADISQLTDLSGNGKHEVQGTAANQPALDSTGGPNGTPEAHLQGAQRYTICASEILASGGRPTYLALQNINSSPGSPSSIRSGFITWYAGATFLSYFDFATSADEGDVITSPSFTTAYHLTEMSYTSPASVRYNGALVTPQPTTDDAAPQIINSTTGQQVNSNGGVACKMVISRAITSAERFAIHDWLNRSEVNGYTYALSLPTS